MLFDRLKFYLNRVIKLYSKPKSEGVAVDGRAYENVVALCAVPTTAFMNVYCAKVT